MVSTILEDNLVGCSIIEDVILPHLAITILEKLHIHTETRMRAFIGSLFVIALTWKQSGYPSTGEWTQRGLVVPII